MIWPLWQWPHCATSRLTLASCTALPTLLLPPVTASMVVILCPAAAEMGVTQERIACPFNCTVQAPHRAAPQPNLVPVQPSVSRSAQRIGVDGSASTWRSWPLI